MRNLNLVEDQPRWRVALVHLFARMVGVLIHVEGWPFGSNRNVIRRPREEYTPPEGVVMTETRIPMSEFRGFLVVSNETATKF